MREESFLPESNGQRRSHGNFVRRIIFIFFSLQINLELHSVSLFLWPIDYSCARAERLGYLMTGSDKHELKRGRTALEEQLDLDDIQTNLLTATPENTLTGIQASLLGVSYDDISRCYQYQVEFNNQTRVSTVRADKIEPCRHGLHFETRDYSLSVIGEFVLACSRFWMTVLLPEAQVVGFALGLMLAELFAKLDTIQTNGLRTWQACLGRHLPCLRGINIISTYWLFWVTQLAALAGAFSSALILLNSTALIEYDQGNETLKIASKPDAMGNSYQETDFLYKTFISGLICRCLIAGSILMRHIKQLNSNSENNLELEDSQCSLKERHVNFILFSLTHLVFLILFWPLSLSFLTSWQQMIWLLTIASCVMILVGLKMEFSCMKYDECRRQFNQQVSLAAGDGRFESLIKLDSAMDSSFIQHDAYITAACSGSSCSKVASKNNLDSSSVGMHENCLPTRREDKTRLVGKDRSQLDDSLVMQSCNVGIRNWSSSSSSEFDGATYQPTTAPVSLACQLHCNGSKIYSQSARVKLIYLLFIGFFNYFLIRAIPNHEFIHPETIASHLKRRQNHVSTYKSTSSSQTIKSMYLLDELTDLAVNGIYADNNKSQTTVGQDVWHPSNAHNQYRRINHYSAEIGSIIKHPDGVLLLIWATIAITGWPSEASAIVLHNCRLFVGLQSALLEPKRLFLLAKYTSRLLFIEWLLLGE